MSLVSLLKPDGPTGFGYGTTAEEVTEDLDLTGKTFLLTGCNSGIGHETLRVLHLRGGHVIAAARTSEKAEKACAGMERTTPVVCELSEPESVRDCADAIIATGRTLNAIIANAGIMSLPELNVKHGYELQFLTNHIGHFILVTRLLDHLADDGRVVLVSSEAHRQAPRVGIELDNLDGSKRYSGWRNYGQSKLANLLFARGLAKRFEGSDRRAYAVHPGVIDTNLTRHMNPLAAVGMKIAGPLALKSIPEGAATQTFCAVHPKAIQNGEYWADCNVKKSTAQGRDRTLAEKLWERSEAIVSEVLPES